VSKTKAVKMRNLHEDFDAVHTMQGIDLDFERGEIFSLQGPNGALGLFGLAVWRLRFVEWLQLHSCKLWRKMFNGA